MNILYDDSSGQSTQERGIEVVNEEGNVDKGKGSVGVTEMMELKPHKDPQEDREDGMNTFPSCNASNAAAQVHEADASAMMTEPLRSSPIQSESANNTQQTPPSSVVTTSPKPVISAGVVASRPTIAASKTTSSQSQIQPSIDQETSKSHSFRHLHKKYSPDLNYMLIEFRKLELQLLGAPSSSLSCSSSQQQQPQIKNEAAGSKERREKLHGFILHLEDTMRQIDEGCKVENEKQQQQQQSYQQSAIDSDMDNTMKDRDKEGQEQAAVQQLEDHILTNLLPVKVRLTRQLAAQRGASHNPATAPVRPGIGGSVGSAKLLLSTSGEGSQPSITDTSSHIAPMTTAKEGTFAAAAEAKRKAHERMLLLQGERRRQLEKGGGGIDDPSSFSSSSSTSTGGDTTSKTTTSLSSTTCKREAAPSSYYGMPIGQASGSFLTSRLHGRVLGGGGKAAASSTPSSSIKTGSSLSNPVSTTAEYASSLSSTPGRRAILYAGMAPGSTQVSSSINAVSGVHPGLIDHHTVQAVTLAEKERIRLERLEDCAARVALGKDNEVTKSVAFNNQGMIASARMSNSCKTPPERLVDGISKTIPHKVPNSSTIETEEHASLIRLKTTTDHQPLAKDGTMTISQQVRKTTRRMPLYLNDPSLTPSQKFELKLEEARWRQRKRRRARRKKRTGMIMGTPIVGGCLLPGSSVLQNVHQVSAQSQQQLLSNGTVPKPIDNLIVKTAEHTSSSIADSIPGVGGNGDVTQKSGSSSRSIEYICAICNEHYPFSCSMNPWWTLSSHDCPKCGKAQIPRLDISAQVNAIDYHPALLAHLDEGNTNIDTCISVGLCDSGVSRSSYPPLESTIPATTSASISAATSSSTGIHVPLYQPRMFASIPHVERRPMNLVPTAGIAHDTANFSDSDVSHTDESDGMGSSSIGNSGYNYDDSSDDEEEVSPATEGVKNVDDDSIARKKLARQDEFGFEYKGDTLNDDQARRLLVLIEHASTCPGRHQSAKHRNVCHSTKYLMLHVRDCSGVLSNGDICPFPWCRKVKHLLFHLVSCEKHFDSNECSICSPPESKLSTNLVALVGLNSHRRRKFRERMKAVLEKRQQLAAVAAVARASAFGVDEKALVERNNETLYPPHLAKTSQIPTTQIQNFASTNQVPQQYANAISRQHPVEQSLSPAPSVFPANQSSKTLPNTALIDTTALGSFQEQQTSPEFSATIKGLPSTLSVSALEQAALELGDIALSTSDLIGLSSPSNELTSAGNLVMSEQPSKIAMVGANEQSHK